MNESQIKFAKNLVVGGTVACASITAVAPLERIKILLQTQRGNNNIPVEARYKGIFDALLRIPSDQGFLSFWRGNGVNVMRYFPTQSLNFAFNQLFQEYILPSHTKFSNFEHGVRNMVCGGLAGGVSLLGVYPLDLTRTRLTVDVNPSGETRYRGMLHCMRSVYKNEGGLPALYRGIGISLCGIIPYRAIYFGGYDNLKKFLLSSNPSFWDRFLVAQLTTTFSQLAAYPFDTVRRHMQLFAGKNKAYSGSWDCFKGILRIEGAKGFYRGFIANTLRGVGGALTLVLFDEVITKL